MKKKFKGQVYRNAIEKLDEAYGWSCNAVEFQGGEKYRHRYAILFSYTGSVGGWFFCNNSAGEVHPEYQHGTKLGRRTREIALELAAHLEDIGEMDRILKQK